MVLVTGNGPRWKMTSAGKLYWLELSLDKLFSENTADNTENRSRDNDD